MKKGMKQHPNGSPSIQRTPDNSQTIPPFDFSIRVTIDCWQWGHTHAVGWPVNGIVTGLTGWTKEICCSFRIFTARICISHFSSCKIGSRMLTDRRCRTDSLHQRWQVLKGRTSMTRTNRRTDHTQAYLPSNHPMVNINIIFCSKLNDDSSLDVLLIQIEKKLFQSNAYRSERTFSTNTIAIQTHWWIYCLRE